MLSVLAKHLALDSETGSLADTLGMTVCGKDEFFGNTVTLRAGFHWSGHGGCVPFKRQ